MSENLIPVEIHGKVVKIPKTMYDNGQKLSARAYAVETGQATWDEMNGTPTPEGEKPTPSGVMENLMASAGREVKRTGSNVAQLYNQLTGDQDAANKNIQDQAEIDRLAKPAKEEFPVSSFLGQALPSFAVPGGKAVQLGVGAAQGALEGDTASQRGFGAGLGLAGGYAGQKVGDMAGQRVQNAGQRMFGNANANARSELIRAGVPLSLSQRTDGVVSKPLTRFFERASFVLTNKQPKSVFQQQRLTELVSDALGTSDKKLTREALGRAFSDNQQVFQNAANRAGGKVDSDSILINQAKAIQDEFDGIGTDSPQVQKIFDRFTDFVTDPNGIDSRLFLKLRSDLSEATTKSDVETSAIVDAIKAMDDRLARKVPDLADDLSTARDRFRLLLALRRGASLSPQGDINVPSFTKSLERTFRNFDVGKPLPGGLREAGESMAAFNQVADNFRSSGTTENALAAGLPSIGANEPGILLKTLAGLTLPFSGGGTGALLGGGTGRSLGLLGAQQLPPDFTK